MVMSLRSALTESPRNNVLQALWAPLGLVELTHKINHHSPIIILFYEWRKQGTEKLSDLPKITHLVSWVLELNPTQSSSNAHGTTTPSLALCYNHSVGSSFSKSGALLLFSNTNSNSHLSSFSLLLWSSRVFWHTLLAFFWCRPRHWCLVLKREI